MPEPLRSKEHIVPEPYNINPLRICGFFRRIHEACDQWPWDLVNDRITTRYPDTMTLNLTLAVEKVCSGSSNVTITELVERITSQMDGRLTYTICDEAWKWVKKTNEERKGATRKSSRPKSTPPNDLLQRLHGGQKNITSKTPVLVTARPSVVSHQKRTIRPPSSTAAEEPPQKFSRTPTTVTRYRNRSKSSTGAPGGEGVHDLGLGAEGQVNSNIAHEPDHGLGVNSGSGFVCNNIDDINAEVEGNIQTAQGVDKFRNSHDDRAMAESILLLEEAHSRLQTFKCELKQEEQSKASLDIRIAETEDILSEIRTGLLGNMKEVSEKQVDLRGLGHVAKALNKDIQGPTEESIVGARLNPRQSIQNGENIGKKLQQYQEELDGYRNHQQTLQYYIEMLSRGIRRSQQEVELEKEKQKVLMLTRDLRQLNPEGLARIFDAGRHRCSEIMVKIQEEKAEG
ncbi:hypothetical protein ACLX1H_009102 [Fusarium chlamydosporum]